MDSARIESMTTTNGSKSPGQLAGRVALISGGAQGIGRGIATLFQQKGACVSILDCDAPAGNDAAAELSAQNPALPVRFLQADLRQQREIHAAVDVVRKSHGRIDVLVNNAGIEMDKSLEALTVDDWNLVLEVNLRGAFLLAQAAVPLFPEAGGAIINISSVHASHAFLNSIPYACSKAALVALTRNLALELGPRKIRVNCIRPGYIDTRLWEAYLRTAPDPKVLAEQTAALHPVGRRGMPADVADAALFFATESSSFITGTDLVVDGGLTVRAHP